MNKNCGNFVLLTSQLKKFQLTNLRGLKDSVIKKETSSGNFNMNNCRGQVQFDVFSLCKSEWMFLVAQKNIHDEQ